jgi:uncharacterized protein (TIGR00730 family)
VYAEAAAELGCELANSGLGLVFGGGRVGLMGILADSVLAAGGQAIGVMPRALVEKEIAHTSLTELHVLESMDQRKALMADLADAFLTVRKSSDLATGRERCGRSPSATRYLNVMDIAAMACLP